MAIDLQLDMINIDHPDYFVNMTEKGRFTDYRLIAHRGGIVEGIFNEFDPKSIQAAIDSNYWMLEIDVRPTEDKKIIVHHDYNFKRLYGVDRTPEDMTLEEIKQLRAIHGNYAPLTFEEVAAMCEGRTRVMLDVKANQPEGWIFTELERVLEKYNLQETVYYIDSGFKKFCKYGKFGFLMKELPEMVERIREGENIAAEYFLFDHGNRINAEAADWCQQLNIDMCAAVNTYHYRKEHDSYGARRDIRHLQQCGITLFQIDSQYDQHF